MNDLINISVVRKKDNFVEQTVDEELIIVPLHKNAADMNSIFSINATGSFIWKRINGINSIENIAKLLTSEYDVDYSKALNDIKGLLLELDNFIEFKN
ncbi:PqqD family protein [Bacteroidota bacterium]